MTEQQWREAFGRVVVAEVKTPEFERFFSVKFTRERAKISLLQLGLFIKHRRDCWAFVSGNCPEMSVKQRILSHEYDDRQRQVLRFRPHGPNRPPGADPGIVPRAGPQRRAFAVDASDALCMGLDDP